MIRGRTSLQDVFIAQEGNGSQFARLHCLRWVNLLHDRGLRTNQHIFAPPIFLVIIAQVKEALPDADDFLQCAVAIDIALVAEIGVNFSQLSKQFFLVISLFFLRTTLAHFLLLFLTQFRLFDLFLKINNCLINKAS